MSYIRAAENLSVSKMIKAATNYPHLATLIPMGDPNARIHARFPLIRQHAVELARTQMNEDMHHLFDTDDDHTSPSFIQRKQQLTTRLKRLIPGSTTSIGAITMPDGGLATSPADIASALERHWKIVFQARGNDEKMLDQWLQTTPNFQGTCDDTLPTSPSTSSALDHEMHSNADSTGSSSSMSHPACASSL